MSTVKRRLFLLTAPLFLAMAAGISAAAFSGKAAQGDPCCECCCEVCPECCCSCEVGPDCCCCEECEECPAAQAVTPAAAGDCDNCCTDCPEAGAGCDPATDCGGCSGQ